MKRWQRLAVLALCSLASPAGRKRRIHHRFQPADATTTVLTFGPPLSSQLIEGLAQSFEPRRWTWPDSITARESP